MLLDNTTTIFAATGNKADIINLLVDDAIGFLLWYVSMIHAINATDNMDKITINVYIVGMTGFEPTTS